MLGGQCRTEASPCLSQTFPDLKGQLLVGFSMDSIRTGIASFSLFLTVETARQGSNKEAAGFTVSFFSILLWRRFRTRAHPYPGPWLW